MPATLARLQCHPDTLVDGAIVAILREADTQDRLAGVADVPVPDMSGWYEVRFWILKLKTYMA